MGTPEKQFGDTFTPYRNAGGFFTVSYLQITKIIALFITLVTILLLLYPISANAELFSHANSEDRNGFNPETNSSFLFKGIHFELPDYYKQSSNDSSTVCFSNQLVKPTSSIIFSQFTPDLALGLDLTIDYFVQHIFKSSEGNEVEYSSYNTKIDGIDIYVLFPDKDIANGVECILAFFVTQKYSQTLNLIYIYEKKSHIK